LKAVNYYCVLGFAVMMSVSLTTLAQVFPRGNGIVLTDKNQFDVYVQIGDWKNMGLDSAEFRLNTLRQFETDLQTAGINRRSGNRNYLVCQIHATRSGDNIAYTASVEVWGLESTDVHVLQWQHSFINLVASNRFNENLVAEQCAGGFVEEWHRWNTE
jgi:hypothetical protein